MAFCNGAWPEQEGFQHSHPPSTTRTNDIIILHDCRHISRGQSNWEPIFSSVTKPTSSPDWYLIGNAAEIRCFANHKSLIFGGQQLVIHDPSLADWIHDCHECHDQHPLTLQTDIRPFRRFSILRNRYMINASCDVACCDIRDQMKRGWNRFRLIRARKE